MITKCIVLFNLLPTSLPHLWLIAADWLEENNKEVEAIAFRERMQSLISSCESYNEGDGRCQYSDISVYADKGGKGTGCWWRSNYAYDWGDGEGIRDTPQCYGGGTAEGDGDGNGNGNGNGDCTRIKPGKY